MKVLILSCNTGEGHNSSAKAIKKYMDAHGIESEVADTLGLISETVSKSISDIYVFSTKNSMFERFYKIGNFVSDMDTKLKSPIYITNKLYAKKLYDYITQGGYDAVICVHLFPAEAITALKRKAKLQIPAIFVATDYAVYPMMHETELDKYVIPHEDLIEEWVEKGVPREKLVPVGIAVDEEKFTSRVGKKEAREKCCELFGWENTEGGKWYLLMSGSMGFGDLGGLISELMAMTEPDDRIICVCGRNAELREKLEEGFNSDIEGRKTRFNAIGFTDQVSTLMDASDVLFSKPGGITSTEAIVKNIPFIHTAPIPGLEDYNARFFHYHNMSYSTVDVLQQAKVAVRLSHDESYRKRMLDAQIRNANPHTCEQICSLVESLVAQI